MDTTNPEIDQDRVFDLADHFEKFGHCMFIQQQKTYKHLARNVTNRTVMEAGCGNGLGTAILERTAESIIGTDKLQRNVDFAKCLYPWIDFEVWDINKPSTKRASIVVCIETIEHVANPRAAIKNLLAVATDKLYIGTPNGLGKKRPPDNPYHVCEYTTYEMLDMIQLKHFVRIHNWENWAIEPARTRVDPLIYEVLL